MASRIEYAREFNKLLEEDWDLFVTITYRRPRGVASAKKSFKQFFKYINIPLGHGMIYKKKIVCWLFIERNSIGKAVHLHALIKGINPTKAEWVERRCCRKFGLSRVLVYDPKKRARYYLSLKYASPWLEEYDYCKINSRARKMKVLRTDGDEFWDKINKKWIPRNQEESPK